MSIGRYAECCMSSLHRVSLLLAGLMLACSGCGTAGLSGYLMDFGQNRITLRDIDQHRTKFIRERDPASFRWLLTHTVDTGMTVQDVNQALGDSGERIDRDQELKAHQGEYLQTDVAYKWGPDRDGQSVVLFFREGRLVHFQPKSFATLDLAGRM
jgi:hypothetical protein